MIIIEVKLTNDRYIGIPNDMMTQNTIREVFKNSKEKCENDDTQLKNL